MRNRKIVPPVLVLIAAAVVVLIFAHFSPENSGLILSIFITTLIVLSLSIIVYFGVIKSDDIIPEMTSIAHVTEHLDTEVILWVDDCSIIHFNKNLRKMIGLKDNEKATKEMMFNILGVENVSSAIIERLIAAKSNDVLFTREDGKVFTISWNTSLFRKTRRHRIFLSAGFDITHIKKMQRTLADTNESFTLSMELSEIGIIMSYDMKKFYASAETVRMLGLKSNSISLNSFRSLIHPNDRVQYDSWLKAFETDKDAFNTMKSIEIRIKSARGVYRWYSYRFKAIRSATDNTLITGGALLDITKEREKDILIERLAYIDEVTEIPNRNKLMEVGPETYEYCRHLNYSYWVIVLDIDRFHIVNDTCGYDKGNELLRNFAHILYKFIGTGGLVARLGGDNFAIVMRDYGDDELPVRTAMTIQEEMNKLAVNEFSSLNLTCSAGYSHMPDDGNSFLGVLEHAEFALKTGSGSQGSISCYEPSMHDSIIGTTEMEKALSDAIDNNELQLYYQPKIDLKTGRIMGVEALIRWIKPDGTIIHPDSFIPVAESSHLVGRISDFVLNEACRQNVLWQKMGYTSIVMSINFASSDFYQKDLKEKVTDALIKSSLEAKWLEVELTETLAMRDINFAVSQMTTLRNLGVQLAMDDFGTGYSSLSYLKILPITLLKLDRSFITNIENDTIAHEIVSSVIRIAKSKGIKTIAEGIENQQQADILRDAGCDYAQGFLYGRPVPPEKIIKFLEMQR